MDVLEGPAAGLLLRSIGLRSAQAALERPALLTQSGATSAPAYYAALRSAAATAAADPDAAQQLLLAGIWSLCAFVQQDLTGPVAARPTPLWQAADAPAASSGAPAAALGEDTAAEDDRWVAGQLGVDGEDLVGRIAGADRLLAALTCLAQPLGHPAAATGGSTDAPVSAEAQPVWAWWAARALSLQQAVLAGRSASLHRSLQTLLSGVLAWAARLASDGGGAASEERQRLGRQLLAGAHLEGALMQQSYGYVEAAAQQLQAAGAALGVSVSLGGALGKRTVHQVDAKAQLVVRLSGGAAEAGGASPFSEGASSSCGAPGTGDALLPVAALGFDDPDLVQELKGMEDESEVFVAPQLEAEPPGTPQPAQERASSSAPSAASAAQPNGGATEQAAPGGEGDEAAATVAAAAVVGQLDLSALEQALLLGWAAQVRKAAAQDELTMWQAAAYVEGVLQQRRSAFMPQAAAGLLKVRQERARPRTRERALLSMERLAAAVAAPSPPGLAPEQRLPLAFSTRFPLQALLRKELAEHYISLGVVGAALRVFEQLEMWEPLIACYSMLGKKPVAQQIISRRLQATPDDAKLWCALGDVSGDDSAYETAWERSGHRSARAMRALAQSALRRKDWAAAAKHFEAALALSPLHPDSWFILGYAYMKLQQPEAALQAYSKCTQVEPEQGEAWNNAAALWLQKERWREAFSCLAEATKHNRDSWQTWENYADAALHVGNTTQAARGLQQVLLLTRGQRLSLPLAERLVGALEAEAERAGGAGDGASSSSSTVAAAAADGEGSDDDGEQPLAATEQLLGLLTLTGELQAASSPATTAAGSSAAAAADSAAAADAAQRQAARLVATVGAVLKEGVAGPAASPALWGLLGRWYGLQGQLESAKEAWLKEVRGLQGTPFASDPAQWAAMADASKRLAGAYVQLYESGAGGVRDLAAARMHLRGVLRVSEERFGDTEEHKQLAALLQRVTELEAAAKAGAA